VNLKRIPLVVVSFAALFSESPSRCRMLKSLVLTALLAANPVGPDNWSEFRNGGSSRASQASYPLRWSPEQGIAWQVELPGYGQSTPIVWEGTVYLIAVEGPMKEVGAVLAYDGKTGEQKWRVQIDTTQHQHSNYAVSRAAPTPMADAKGVYAFFEGGNVLAVDHAGKVKWEHSLVKEYGEYQNHHGLGSSPAQSDTALFINCQHDGPSYLVALDKETGKTLWKVDRKSSKSWSSPIAFRSGDRDFVAISTAGAAHVCDAKNGEVVWSMSELSGNSVPSPVLIGNQLFLGAAKSDFDSDGNVAKSNCCLKSTGDGTFELVWRAEKAMCDYASPVVAGDFVYYVSRVGVIYCLDRATGKEHFAKRLSGTTWSTPIVAGEHLYIFGKEGGTTVLKVGPAYEEVAMNPLWDPKNPPAPLTYKETKGGMGHGEHGGGGQAGAAPAGTGGAAAGAGGRPRGQGGFAGMLLKHDANGNGKVQLTELPEDLKRMASGDKNGDGAIDADEIKVMAEDFRKRRENSSSDSRDPIVYGIAAAGGTFYIRTGTRLYAIREGATAERQP
jgi:outer membrane protein assembly factor BamB